MPRFAILEHDWPARHWDVFLEAGPVLRAWRVLADPDTAGPLPAEPAADHRAVYLDYEGEVSAGRGAVARWDGGTFEWVRDEPGRVVVDLRGGRRRGRASLEQRDGGAWVFEWVPGAGPGRGR